ncbi:UbiA prenyltransferase family protein [Candidatus Woesebacteria bacterium]|nr:UbiA prenyltransferase family protein [Candidatus Woesebacteria bacterium]
MANLPTKIITTASSLVRVARPVHWIKNLALFAALIFTGDLYNQPLFIKVIWGVVTFNLVTSATYIFNDVLDVKLDRLHPIKKYRPVASGRLSPSLALIVAFSLAVFALSLAKSLNPLFFFAVASYLALQALYSLGLKNLAIIDILIIAAGFIIRVYAGAFVIDAHLSVWFLLCVISSALFLAAGKRRAELNLLPSGATRESLTNYKSELLNSYVTMFGNAAWMSWALFTFFESPRASLPVWLFLAELSRTTTVNKLLMLTIPVTIFGIMRYESLIFEGKSEAPEKLLLTDVALVSSVVLWIGLVVWILYGGIASYI